MQGHVADGDVITGFQDRFGLNASPVDVRAGVASQVADPQGVLIPLEHAMVPAEHRADRPQVAITLVAHDKSAKIHSDALSRATPTDDVQ